MPASDSSVRIQDRRGAESWTIDETKITAKPAIAKDG